VSAESYEPPDETDRLLQQDPDIVLDCQRILNVDSDEVNTTTMMMAVTVQKAEILAFNQLCST
jgi:hypothetical protein